MVYTLDSQPQSAPWYWDRRRHFNWWVFAAVTGMAAGIALVSGILMVTFLWHWRQRGYRLALLLPFVIAAALVGYFVLDDMYEEIFWWAVRVALGYALLEALFMALGIKIGRPIARGLLRMFVPPKPRQHFAFLWQVDGKTPPPVIVHSA
jgi:MFS family permease